MRQKTWLTMAGLFSGLVLLLTPTLLEAQADTVRPHVIEPEEGHTSVSPLGVRTEFMVGSVSTGASQLMVGKATLPPGHETPTHLHEIDEEVVYVLEGELTAILEGEEHTVGPFGITRKTTRSELALAAAPAELIEVLGLESHETPERREASGGRLVSSADALRYPYRLIRGSLGRRMRHLR